LCLLLFRDLQPAQENFLVGFLKTNYLRVLAWCLRHRWTTLALMATLLLVTVLGPMSSLGREFMPELEEGNLWIRATFPVHISLDGVAGPVRQARHIIGSAAYPELQTVIIQCGRPDDGTDPGGFNNVEFFVPMKPEKDWPVVLRPCGVSMRRTRQDIIADMSAELASKLPGIEWSFSQYIRDNVMEAISGVKGDNSVKIYGPDLAKLEELAKKTKNILCQVHGLFDIGIFRIMGQSNLEFAVDKDKCNRWGVHVADVNNVIDSAVHGKALTQMVEGEKTFDITLRWPLHRRQDDLSILEIPVDVVNNQLTPGSQPASPLTILTGPSTGPSSTGTSAANPATISSGIAPYNPFLPRLRLQDLVSPVGEDGRPDPTGSFVRPGGSLITRENGNRFIAVKFGVRDRDLASAVAEVQEKITHVFQAPYRFTMGGEFVQMEDAETRLLIIIPASLALICLLLYFAFRSLLDVTVVLSNVLFCAIGGIWALYVTGTNFSISAAVGFISLFGVAIMDGLLLISYFNALCATGLPLHEAIMRGAGMRVRPVLITDLTAILGLLPAAIATQIGAQTQRPLAIVVVGGMLLTLLFAHYPLPVLYSFYGNRKPPEGASSMAH
jgi:cobalt-zinc-cadmium resistance protein CzcA